jgi:hypothetical protein
MGTWVFFLSRLRDGVEQSDYEQWVREVDLPTARAIPAVLSYEVVRLDGALRDNEVPYDYVEVLEVSELGAYARQLEEIPDRAAFSAAWRGYVGETVAVHGTSIG